MEEQKQIDLEKVLSDLPSNELREEAVKFLAYREMPIPKEHGSAVIRKKLSAIINDLKKYRQDPKINIPLCPDPAEPTQFKASFTAITHSYPLHRWQFIESMPNVADIAFYSGLVELSREIMSIVLASELKEGQKPLVDHNNRLSEPLLKRYSRLGKDFCITAGDMCARAGKDFSAQHLYLAGESKDKAANCLSRRGQKFLESLNLETLANDWRVLDKVLTEVGYYFENIGRCAQDLYMAIAKGTGAYRQVLDTLAYKYLENNPAEVFEFYEKTIEHLEKEGNQEELSKLEVSLWCKAIMAKQEIHFADLEDDAQKRIDARLKFHGDRTLDEILKFHRGRKPDYEVLGDIARKGVLDDEADKFYLKRAEEIMKWFQKGEYGGSLNPDSYTPALRLMVKVDAPQLRAAVQQHLIGGICLVTSFMEAIGKTSDLPAKLMDIAKEIGFSEEVVAAAKRQANLVLSGKYVKMELPEKYKVVAAYFKLAGDDKQADLYQNLSSVFEPQEGTTKIK